MKIIIRIHPLTLNDLFTIVKPFNLQIPDILSIVVAKFGILNLKPLIELAALKKLRAFLQEQNVQAEIRSIDLLTDSQASAITGISVDVQSVNAESVVLALLPALRKVFSEKPELKPVSDVLDILGDDAKKAAQGALAPLKDEQLEAVMRTLVSAYGDSLCKIPNELLTQKEIPVTIEKIELY